MNHQELLRSKIMGPILDQLTRGLSPDAIALTAGVGMAIAVIPVVGVTTVLSLLAAWALRLNQPVMQAINWTTYPIQLLLIFPYIRFGERLFGAPRLTLSLQELVAMGKADPVGTIHRLSATLGHAVAAWGLTVPLIVVGVYLGTRPLFRALARRAVPAPRADKGIDDVA